MRPYLKLTAALLGLSVLVGCSTGGGPSADTATVAGDAVAGRALFATNCASCHGPAGEGTSAGPSFLSDVYVPSHHADESFQRAVALGVQAHHWDFGPMPMVPGLDRADVADVVAHVRQLQRDAGLID